MCGEIDQGCHLDLEVSWGGDFNHTTDFFHRYRAILVSFGSGCLSRNFSMPSEPSIGNVLFIMCPCEV